jgi:hypothetical protein
MVDCVKKCPITFKMIDRTSSPSRAIPIQSKGLLLVLIILSPPFKLYLTCYGYNLIEFGEKTVKNRGELKKVFKNSSVKLGC